MQINCLKLLLNIIPRTTASIHITTFEKPNQSPAQEIWDMPKKTSSWSFPLKHWLVMYVAWERMF